MSDILSRLGAIDPLAFLFMGLGLLFAWGIFKVLADDLDLRTPPPAEAREGEGPGDHPGRAPEGRRAA